MDSTINRILASQLEASLCMLHECIVKCPHDHWRSRIAKYPFWHVAYHTLCFVDCYLSKSNEEFQRLLCVRAEENAANPETNVNFHPAEMNELSEEYPSREFNREELLAYARFCRTKIHEVLGDTPASETADSLQSPSGFSWLPFTRAELHIYNARHVQHHAGQLAAFLRKVGVDTAWVKRGWKER